MIPDHRKLDGYVKQIADSMPITINLRENAMVIDLIAELELEHDEKLKAIEAIAENEKVERLQAEQEAEKERQHTRAAILNLYQNLHLEPALIATIFEISEQEVMDILEAAE